MPIRLNLLAEQQAAEEARRRDPVKRAIWAGSALVGLMIVWAVFLQLRLISAKAELSRCEERLATVDNESKDARTHWAAESQIETRIANLRRYSTNRFFCANALDALQQLMPDEVRVVELQSSHQYTTNAEVRFKTNLVFTIEPARHAWQFWRSSQPQANVLTLVSNQLATITNTVEALKSAVSLATKIEVTTNEDQATASIEIVKPTTSLEQVTLTIKARDYGSPPGKRVDDFSKAIANHPYFVQRLRAGEGEGIRLRERAIQAELDPMDPVTPNKPFIPFTIECRYRVVARAND